MQETSLFSSVGKVWIAWPWNNKGRKINDERGLCEMRVGSETSQKRLRSGRQSLEFDGISSWMEMVNIEWGRQSLN